MTTSRSHRRLRALAVTAIAAMAILATAGCGGKQSAPPASEADNADPCTYKNGRLSMATGNTVGVYYILGGGYADLISTNLKGCKATAEATGGSVENIQKVASGASDIAFTLADTAADAANGKGTFTSPQPIRALGRIYTNYTQVIVRTGANIKTVADMKGKKVSTSSPNSGTEVIAFRLLKAAGLDPAKDITKQSVSLNESVQGMKDGTIDAMFWSGGLPTAGITDLITSQKEKVSFLKLDDLLPKMQSEHGQAYQATTLSKDVYKTAADVPTIAVPNMIVVSDKMPRKLAYELTKLLFDKQADLVKIHPEAKNISKDNGPKVDPVKLHDGAKDYFDGK